MRIQIFAMTLLALACAFTPCRAQDRTYRIEVLQVTAIDELQQVYDGFLGELEKNGLVPGRNLTVKRTVIDFDMESQSWSSKVRVYWKLNRAASRIAREKPDLVLTMGNPVTKFSKDAIVGAGIPLVFTALASPEKVGCRSLAEAGPGFTGSTTHTDMKEALGIVRTAFPDLKTVGVVHSEYSGSTNHVEDALKEGPALGFAFVTRQAGMKDRITPLLRELQAQGVQAIAVPGDPYYEVRSYEPARELLEFSKASRIPVISFALGRFQGSVLDVGVELGTIGSLAGQQAVRILKEGARPGILPILRQQGLTVLVDRKAAQSLGIKLPPAILQTARPAGSG